MKRSTRLLLGMGLVVLVTTQSWGGSFEILPSGGYQCFPRAISADGSTVAGQVVDEQGSQAFYWTKAAGMVRLGRLPGGSHTSVVRGVSADGTVLAGYSDTGDAFPYNNGAFRWTARDGMQRLPREAFYAWDISADGSVIVGSEAVSLSASAAYRYEYPGKYERIGLWKDAKEMDMAWAVSGDGSIVAGGGRAFVGGELRGGVVRWDSSQGVSLVAAGGAEPAISSDGTTIVGYYNTGENHGAFRWKAGSLIGLGSLPGLDGQLHTPMAVSGDGSIVVGGASNQAFIWDETHGMRSLSDVLTKEHGIDLAGWTLAYATAISDDGKVIAGLVHDSRSYTYGFVAVVPEPSGYILVGTGSIALPLFAWRRRRRAGRATR